MGDEDDRVPFSGKGMDDLEETVSLLRRQGRRRFVQDQDLRAAIEGLDNLDPLL